MPFNNKLKYLYILLAAISLAIGAIGFVLLQNSPYTGLTYGSKNPGHYYISNIDKDGPASIYSGLEGAEIVRIGDMNLTGVEIVNPNNHGRLTYKEFLRFIEAHKYFFSYIKLGKEIEIQVINKNGESTTLVVKPTVHPIYTVLKDVGTLYLAALCFIIIATLLIRKENKDPRAKLFFIFSLLYATTCIAMGIGSYVEPGFDYRYFLFLIGLNGISLWIGIAAMLHFALIFPKANRFEKNQIFIISIYVIAIIIAIVTTMRIYFDAYFIFMLIYSILIITSMTYNFFTASSITEKMQIKWIIWGILSSLIIGNAFFFIPLILTGKPIIAENPLLLIGILIPISMTFAIMKYRLMDIDTLFDNTIIYTTTLALLAVLDIAVITMLVKFKILQLYSPVTLIASVWLIIFTYIPVRNFMQKGIKKIFRREIYDINAVLLDLSKNFISATDIRSAFTKAHQAIDAALHPKGIDTYIADQHGHIATSPEWTDAQTLQTLTVPTHLYLIGPSDNDEDSRLPDNYAGGICVPLIGMKRTWGYIVLQDKYSGRLYDKDDIKLLSLISGQLAMTIEALQYKEELRLKEEEAKEKDARTAKEKEMVIKDIHDGIGGTLTNINLLGYMGGQKTSEPEIKTFFNTISELAKESIFEIHNLYAILEGKNADWAMIISGIKQFGESMLNPHGIELSFRYQIEENTPGSISNQMFINLYKIYKEAISNIVKYSRADRVNVMLDIKKNILTFSIRDNGIGLAGDKTNGRGLKHMRERVGEIGGKIEITSDNGVHIIIELPLHGG